MTRLRLIYCLLLFAASLSAQELVLRHPPDLAGWARRIESRHADLVDRAADLLGLTPNEPIAVILTRNRDDFVRAVENEGGATPAEHVDALAFPLRGLIVLQTEAWTVRGDGDFAALYLHELTHCLLGEAEIRHRRKLPTWLHEGLAQWVADRVYLGTPDVLAQAVAEDALLPFAELVDAFPASEGASRLAYAQSLALVRLIEGEPATTTPGRMKVLVRGLLLGEEFGELLRRLTGLGEEDLVAALRGEFRDGMGGIRSLPSFLWSGALLVIMTLLFATHWSRRARALARLDDFDVDARTQGDDPVAAASGSSVLPSEERRSTQDNDRDARDGTTFRD